MGNWDGMINSTAAITLNEIFSINQSFFNKSPSVSGEVRMAVPEGLGVEIFTKYLNEFYKFLLFSAIFPSFTGKICNQPPIDRELEKNDRTKTTIDHASGSTSIISIPSIPHGTCAPLS